MRIERQISRSKNLKKGGEKKKGEFPTTPTRGTPSGKEGGRVTYEISTSIIPARNPFTGQPQPGTRHYNAPR